MEVLNAQAKELNHSAKEIQKSYHKNKMTIDEFKEQFVDVKKKHG